MNTKTKEITLIGLMAAVTCIAGPLSLALPFSPVPISLTNLAIYFSVYILGMKRGTISYLVYLLLGLVGLPVFSAFTSGPAKLFGPTGGYLIGFIFMALICGYCVDRWNGRFVSSFAGMAVGTAVCYLFGTVWLAYQMSSGSEQTFIDALPAAFAAGVLPFIAVDLAKMVLSLLIGSQVRVRVRKAALN
ncbi:MAG: biotin transporter BioY [Lachnospiraceae bacterium]|nr:biotin transporter BioY [Lachnospiraceae bacterium]MDE7028635.1 biotin transporter BioY [Lachnospiraceae bacterium]